VFFFWGGGGRGDTYTFYIYYKSLCLKLNTRAVGRQYRASATKAVGSGLIPYQSNKKLVFTILSALRIKKVKHGASLYSIRQVAAWLEVYESLRIFTPKRLVNKCRSRIRIEPEQSFTGWLLCAGYKHKTNGSLINRCWDYTYTFHATRD